MKTCKSCQVNKHKKQKYGKLPPKLVFDTPWETLCVDLIGPYALSGKDRSEIDFMCLTMVDPASSWFEIAEEQLKDKSLQQQKGLIKYEEILVENTYVLCKNGKLIIQEHFNTKQ